MDFPLIGDAGRESVRTSWYLVCMSSVSVWQDCSCVVVCSFSLVSSRCRGRGLGKSAGSTSSSTRSDQPIMMSSMDEEMRALTFILLTKIKACPSTGSRWSSAANSLSVVVLKGIHLFLCYFESDYCSGGA